MRSYQVKTGTLTTSIVWADRFDVSKEGDLCFYRLEEETPEEQAERRRTRYLFPPPERAVARLKAGAWSEVVEE